MNNFKRFVYTTRSTNVEQHYLYVYVIASCEEEANEIMRDKGHKLQNDLLREETTPRGTYWLSKVDNTELIFPSFSGFEFEHLNKFGVKIGENLKIIARSLDSAKMIIQGRKLTIYENNVQDGLNFLSSCEISDAEIVHRLNAGAFT